MKNLEQNYLHVLKKIILNDNVTLVGVSKTFPSDTIRELYNLGQKDFGENYAQEFNQKVGELKDLDIIWHFIGNIQSNKIKLIASKSHWVHSISNSRQILKLSNQRPVDLPKLNILLEVNITGKETRHGVKTFEELLELANLIKNSNNLQFRGLMGIASATNDKKIITKQFQTLKNYFNKLQKNGFNIDTLSMGMSNDYELAIKNGSTMIRIGTLIFGNRNKTLSSSHT